MLYVQSTTESPLPPEAEGEVIYDLRHTNYDVWEPSAKYKGDPYLMILSRNALTNIPSIFAR